MKPRTLEQQLDDAYQQGYVNGHHQAMQGGARPWLAKLSAFFLGAAMGVALAMAVIA